MNAIQAHCPHYASTLTSVDTNPLQWSQAPLALERPDLISFFFFFIIFSILAVFKTKLTLVLPALAQLGKRTL